MNPQEIQLYLSFLAPSLGLLCTTVVFLQKFVKNKKLKKILEKTSQITKMIIPCVIEAEKFDNYTGAEKKEYVMTRLNQYAIENKIKFNSEEASIRVEELVSLTKGVNTNKVITSYEQENKQAIETQIQNIITGMKG